MPTLTFKNVPDELYQQLKCSAALHRRSLNHEAIVCLERALSARPTDPGAFLAAVRRFRESLGDRLYLTDKDLQAAKPRRRP